MKKRWKKRNLWKAKDINALPTLTSRPQDVTPFFSLITSIHEDARPGSAAHASRSAAVAAREKDDASSVRRRRRGLDAETYTDDGGSRKKPVEMVHKTRSKPSSRMEAVVLREWVQSAISQVDTLTTRSLSMRSKEEPSKMSEATGDTSIGQPSIPRDTLNAGSTRGVSFGLGSLDENVAADSFSMMGMIEKSDTVDITAVVEQTVPKLSMSLHEIIQQVASHCAETGMVLEKVWRTYVELFDRVLKDLKQSLRTQNAYVNKVVAELTKTRKEIQDIKITHPQHVNRLSETLNTKFSQRHKERCNRLAFQGSENNALRVVLEERKKDIAQLFPNFDKYKHLVFDTEPPKPAKGNDGPTAFSLASDIQFLLKATQDREEIPVYIGPLLSGGASEEISALAKKWQENTDIIAELQAEAADAATVIPAQGRKTVRHASIVIPEDHETAGTDESRRDSVEVEQQTPRKNPRTSMLHIMPQSPANRRSSESHLMNADYSDECLNAHPQVATNEGDASALAPGMPDLEASARSSTSRPSIFNVAAAARASTVSLQDLDAEDSRAATPT